MKVIVDTCIWSLALRRNTQKSNHLVEELKELISEVRVQLVGPIRQELLSGIKSKKQFRDLRDHLTPFPDLQLESKDFYNITKRTLELSKQYCDGKVVSILEGGYDLQALKESTEMHVKALLEFN